MTIMLHTSEIFDTWLLNLADKRARARIDIRLVRIGMGLLGDVRPVGEGVSELRIDYGPGYRIYFAMQNNTQAVILIGGNKSSQKRDIARAKTLWAEIKE